MPIPPANEDSVHISGDARLSMGTIEPLQTLKARMQEPDTFGQEARSTVNFPSLIGKIDALVRDLQALTTASSGMPADEVQKELEAEGQKRSAGQAERQKRLAPCNAKSSPSTNDAGLGQARSPQTSQSQTPAARPQPTQ